MKRILFLLLLSVFSYVLIAQTGPSKKCPMCGLSMAQCQYKGKHPKCSTCGKLLTECQYKGNHPKCSTCGELLTQCQYKGKHPKCSTCGKLLTQCQYKGNHPKCSTCGKLLTECQYGGNHGTINGHEWVDLGLSVKWATCNVGAGSPSDYGGYYAWGETQPKSRYDWDNSFDCLDDKGDSWGTYKVDGQKQIAPTSGHDTARENWGGRWRMPTDAENEELCKKCKWIWTIRGDHNGYIVTGPNGNSIFLPAAGIRNGMDSYYVGEGGAYWSSTLSLLGSYGARYLSFVSSGDHGTYDSYRCFGKSVRPVAD
ncbi:MAG: hypothetical protein K2M96_09625 [Prevotella sp.]|nr:hypothetical protein [Prevotella sp.]